MTPRHLIQQAAVSAVMTIIVIVVWQFLPVPTRFHLLSSSLIELEGASGQIRLASMSQPGATGLTVSGPGGKGSITLEVTPNGTPSVVLRGADGGSSVSVLLPADGVPVISATKPPKFRGWEAPG